MTDQIDMRPIRLGAFLIHRSTKPRQRHDTFAAAERECERLLNIDPGGTYIVSREEARISRQIGRAHV